MQEHDPPDLTPRPSESPLGYEPVDGQANARDPKYYVIAGKVLGVWFGVHLFLLLVTRPVHVRGVIEFPDILLVISGCFSGLFAGATLWDALTDRDETARKRPQVILAWFAIGLLALTAALILIW